ncbi:MAG: polyprenyl synthetase family protein [Bacteroidales bacterium]|nr:polyprenyl synthetase family protein [Bacteroidales bacterium]
MSREAIIKLLGNHWDGFERLVRESLRSDIALLNVVNESIMSNAGKQLRPMLLLLVAGSLGVINDDSLHFAAAVELLHNATLLHDDVADRSSTRRGQPTLSALIGPSSAVLVGDFWLTKAVDMVLDAKRKDKAVPLFSRTLSDLAEGEMLQLEKANEADTTEEDYLRIIYCKTASLFRTACMSAALSVDAGPEQCEAAARYGNAMGLAFQIRDDIFDYTDGNGLGKPVGLDLMEKKITLPLIGALRNSDRAGELRDMVRGIDEHPEYCGQLRGFVLENGGLEYAAARLDDYIKDATAALDVFPESPGKECLASLAGYNAIRNT